MRRPSPLPAPAARPAPAPPGLSDSQGANAGGRTATLAEEPPAAEAGASFAPDAADDRTSATPDAPTPVGLRDVWRAARARRRALRSEVRRFTVRARRRRAVWLGAIAAVVLLALATLGAAYSPLFAVERIDIAGARNLDTAAVQAALADQIGKPLPLVDESAVKAALVGFPLIESYDLEAQPPHDLVLRIVERTPIGVVRSAAGYTLVDAAGVALATTSSRPSGEPLIDVTGGTGSAAFESAGQVMRALPDAIREKVTAVSATTRDDVSLTLGDTGSTIVWGSADQSALKAVVLETAMKKLPPSKVDVYDVSSPEAVVVR